MTRTVSALSLAMLLVSLALFAAAGQRFRPGLWEVTASTAGPHPSSKSKTRCYTPEEVKVANGSAAEVAAATRANAATRSFESKGCKIADLQVAGDRITEVVQCPSFTWKDVTTYLPGDRFEADTTMTPKKGAEHRIHQAAHRVGDCTGKP